METAPPATPAAATPAAGNAYLRVLKIPGALGFVVAGFIGRMPMSMLNLGIILLVSAMTGRYGTAGAVAATGSICYAVLVPRLGRLMDRFGQARVVRPLTAVFGMSAVAFVLCARAHAPLWTLYAAGGVLGGTMPSLGSMVRARWSYLLGGARSGAADAALLHTAFSLESVADELIFITGPAIVTILATQVEPTAGVVSAALLSVTGTLWLAAQRGTEPPAAPRGTRGGSAIRIRGMLVFVAIYVFLGAQFGTIDLSTIAFAAERGHKPLAGLVLGTYALGSAVGGLWYGARQWHSPLGRRFLITLVAMTLGIAPMWAVQSLPVLFVVMFFSGLCIAPTLIGGFSLIERRMPAHLLTEGMSWLSTSIGVGLALGPPIAGRIIDAHGAHWGYAFALCCGSAAAAVALLGVRRVRPPHEPGPPPVPAVAPQGEGAGQNSDMVPPCQAAQPQGAQAASFGGTGRATRRPGRAGPPHPQAPRTLRLPFGRRNSTG